MIDDTWDLGPLDEQQSMLAAVEVIRESINALRARVSALLASDRYRDRPGNTSLRRMLLKDGVSVLELRTLRREGYPLFSPPRLLETQPES